MRALLLDVDGVLRRRDPAADIERAAGLPEGSVLKAAFEPDLLTAAITGQLTQDAWEAEVGKRVDHPDAVRRIMGDIGYLDQEVVAIVDSVRPHATVCLVSNATDRLRADIAALGLRVDHIVSSAELGVAKPDPRIFTASAMLCGAPIEQCLMVDDTAEITAAATAVGMTSHTFTSAEKMRRAIDDWLAMDFTDTTTPMMRERESVRVLCLDHEDRLLLLQWRDPVSGELMWEPPGGGVEGDEDLLTAAHRELAEETGLVGVDIGTAVVRVRKHQVWAGRINRNLEPFVLARVPAGHVAGEPQLTPYEKQNLLGTRWWSWSEMLGTTERIRPQQIPAVLRTLAPGGPWQAVARIGP